MGASDKKCATYSVAQHELISILRTNHIVRDLKCILAIFGQRATTMASPGVTMFRILRYARLSGLSARKIHSSPVSEKSVVDKVTEAADKVNKKVSQGLASAIEAGEKVKESAKESMSSMGEQAKSKTNEAAKDAKETTKKVADDAEGKMNK